MYDLSCSFINDYFIYLHCKCSLPGLPSSIVHIPNHLYFAFKRVQSHPHTHSCFTPLASPYPRAISLYKTNSLSANWYPKRQSSATYVTMTMGLPMYTMVGGLFPESSRVQVRWQCCFFWGGGVVIIVLFFSPSPNSFIEVYIFNLWFSSEWLHYSSSDAVIVSQRQLF